MIKSKKKKKKQKVGHTDQKEKPLGLKMHVNERTCEAEQDMESTLAQCPHVKTVKRLKTRWHHTSKRHDQ